MKGVLNGAGLITFGVAAPNDQLFHDKVARVADHSRVNSRLHPDPRSVPLVDVDLKIQNTFIHSSLSQSRTLSLRTTSPISNLSATRVLSTLYLRNTRTGVSQTSVGCLWHHASSSAPESPMFLYDLFTSPRLRGLLF